MKNKALKPGDRVMLTDDAWKQTQSGRRAGTFLRHKRSRIPEFSGQAVVQWDGLKQTSDVFVETLCPLDTSKIGPPLRELRRTAPSIEMIGIALYGFGWQEEMARILGVTSRTIRRWANAEWPLPFDAREKLLRQMRKRRDELDDMVRGFRPSIEEYEAHYKTLDENA